MTNDTVTMISAASRQQLDEVSAFLETLDQNGRKSLLDFFQGAKFMQNLMSAPASGAEKRSGA